MRRQRSDMYAPLHHLWLSLLNCQKDFINKVLADISWINVTYIKHENNWMEINDENVSN